MKYDIAYYSNKYNRTLHILTSNMPKVNAYISQLIAQGVDKDTIEIKKNY